MRKLLSMPGYTLSAMVLIIILYLTLHPKPLPDIGSGLFEGADKVVHMLMFLGMAGILGLDYLRSPAGRYKPEPPRFIVLLAVVISSVIGALVEVAQGAINMGRGEDFYDFLADVAGAIIAGLIMMLTWKRVYCWWWNREQ